MIPTRRLFPILAAVAGLLLVLGLARGLAGGGDLPGRGVREVAAASAVGVHAMAFVFLRASSRRVEATAGRLGLPDWVGALAEKNRRKGLAYEVPGSTLAVAGAASALLAPSEVWGAIVEGATVSFQLGAFLGEGAIVAGQSRLLLGLRDAPGRPVL